MDLKDHNGRFSRGPPTTKNLFGGVCWRKVIAKSLESGSTNYFAGDLELALNDTRRSAKQHAPVTRQRSRRSWPHSSPPAAESACLGLSVWFAKVVHLLQ